MEKTPISQKETQNREPFPIQIIMDRLCQGSRVALDKATQALLQALIDNDQDTLYKDLIGAVALNHMAYRFDDELAANAAYVQMLDSYAVVTIDYKSEEIKVKIDLQTLEVEEIEEEE